VGAAFGTLPTTTRTGYSFAGWFVSSALTGTAITTSTTVPASNTTYYAKWTASTVTITWSANGGSVSPTTQNKTVGSAFGTLPTATRTGYTLAGWFTTSAASGGTQVTSTSRVPTTSTTYYARWNASNTNTSFANAIVITLNSSVSVTVGAANQKRYYSFTPSTTGSYTFESSNRTGDPYGWLYNSNQSQITTDDDSAENLNFRITHNLTAGQLYYIAAGCYNTGTGSYMLRVTPTRTIDVEKYSQIIPDSTTMVPVGLVLNGIITYEVRVKATLKEAGALAPNKSISFSTTTSSTSAKLISADARTNSSGIAYATFHVRGNVTFNVTVTYESTTKSVSVTPDLVANYATPFYVTYYYIAL
jgi:uncharacterized repeat protein (TIGR02543 family)